MKAAKDLLKNYCTSIVLPLGIRLDLFTPSMFRFRMSTLEGEKFPEKYEIPFAMGKLEKWSPVAYRHWTEYSTLDFVETDVLRIRISRDLSEGKQFMVWTKDRQRGFIRQTHRPAAACSETATPSSMPQAASTKRTRIADKSTGSITPRRAATTTFLDRSNMTNSHKQTRDGYKRRQLKST